MKPDMRALLREQLDRQLRPFHGGRAHRPALGWVRSIREALGMNGRQLAERMNIARSQLSKIEEAETREATSLRTLQRAAEALGCDLVYAFVPRDGKTLDELVHERAREVAKRTMERVQTTMSLEAQDVDTQFLKRETDRLTAELVRTMRRNLWDE